MWAHRAAKIGFEVSQAITVGKVMDRKQVVVEIANDCGIYLIGVPASMLVDF